MILQKAAQRNEDERSDFRVFASTLDPTRILWVGEMAKGHRERSAPRGRRPGGGRPRGEEVAGPFNSEETRALLARAKKNTKIFFVNSLFYLSHSSGLNPIEVMFKEHRHAIRRKHGVVVPRKLYY